MKKLFASLMALVLMVSMMTSAMAYIAITPENNQPAITHTLALTEPDMTKLNYEITYSFAVSATPSVVQPTDIINPSYAVTGAPVIADLTYGPTDTFDSNRNCTKSLQIDWSGVSIKEPGVYRWEVTKTVTDTDNDYSPTNQSAKTYLYVYAQDNGGTLTIESIGLTTDADLDGNASTKGNLSDNYPAQTLDLSVSKTVTGNQGSRDQYFKFTVSLTSPNGAASTTHTISGHDTQVPATAYHEAKTNVTSITTIGGSTSSVELWLKHGQTVTISNLVFGTSYNIVESENAGYTVTATITGDATDSTTTGATASDTALKESTTVAYNNFKDATVPTGVLPMSSAPIAMMLAAAVMMLINKRKAAK